jgi:lysyl-tRNA synthetase class 2
VSDDQWRPCANHAALKRRARLLGDIRGFFHQRGVLEVETPILSAAGNSDTNLAPFRTEGTPLWLRTSPEYALKRLLAAGSGDVFELGRVFRSAESGRHHNPEFTMLEWYRLGWNHHQLMEETVALVRECGHGHFDDWPLQHYSYHDLFVEFTGIEPHTAGEAELAARAAELGVVNQNLQRNDWLDLVFSEVIQPALPTRSMLLVEEFPADQAALARVRDSEPPVAERFELLVGGQELANGYWELTDAAEQSRRFEAENAARHQRGQPVVPLDRNLLAAMRHGLPDCAGVALGVDRLLMTILGSDSIDEVIAFPAGRA